MTKYLGFLLMGTALLGCDVIANIGKGLEQDQEAANTPAARGVVTRASVEASDLSVVRAAASVEGIKFASDDYYIALANNNGTVSYGNEGKTYLTLRGGMVISQYFLGNDLTGVMSNADDPIQYPRPYASWPASYERIYQLPGDGLQGELVRVTCQHQAVGSGVVDILEVKHSTALIEENCEGDVSLENTYMIDAQGQVWRSEQWAGKNPNPIYIDIVEPLT